MCACQRTLNLLEGERGRQAGEVDVSVPVPSVLLFRSTRQPSAIQPPPNYHPPPPNPNPSNPHSCCSSLRSFISVAISPPPLSSPHPHHHSDPAPTSTPPTPPLCPCPYLHPPPHAHLLALILTSPTHTITLPLPLPPRPPTRTPAGAVCVPPFQPPAVAAASLEPCSCPANSLRCESACSPADTGRGGGA